MVFLPELGVPIRAINIFSVGFPVDASLSPVVHSVSSDVRVKEAVRDDNQNDGLESSCQKSRISSLSRECLIFIKRVLQEERAPGHRVYS